MPDNCPSCRSLSLALAHLHCGLEQRARPCGWVRCDCGAIVRPDGLFIPPPPPSLSKGKP